MNNLRTSGSVKLHFRTLTEEDALQFKRLRLTAIQQDASMFLTNYVEEAGLTLEQWKAQVQEDSGEKAFFGAFNGGNLVAISGVKRMEKEPYGEIAYWRSEYTSPQYRNLGVAAQLYQLRIDWCLTHGFNCAMWVINETNAINRAFHVNRGANLVGTEPMLFADNVMHNACWYFKELPKLEHGMRVL